MAEMVNEIAALCAQGVDGCGETIDGAAAVRWERLRGRPRRSVGRTAAGREWIRAWGAQGRLMTTVLLLRSLPSAVMA